MTHALNRNEQRYEHDPAFRQMVDVAQQAIEGLLGDRR